MYAYKKKIRFFFEAFAIAARNFFRDDCLTVSGSISFVFLLAVIPFSALFLFLLRIFKDIFLPGLFPDNMVDILVDDMIRLIPFVPREWIQTHLIDSVGVGSFTTINLLMLPIISGLLFKSLDVSIRRIFQLDRRNLIKSHALYALMSIFAILLFFMANFMWTIVGDAVEPLQRYFEQNPYIHSFYAKVLDYVTFGYGNLLSWLILVMFFLMTLKLFIPMPIKLRHRLAGGALFGGLWLLARLIFGWYIQHVARINVLFGSLSSVCIIMLWVFYSSVALLYSAEFVHALHCGPYREHFSRKSVVVR